MRQLVLEFLDCKPGQPGARKKVLLSELEDDMKMNDIDSSAYQRAGGYDRLCSVIVELVQEGRLQPVKRAPGNGRVRIPQEVLTVFDIQYHIVWTTKYRYKVLQGNVAERLRILIRQGCEARNIQIVRASIGKEHVLLLISCPPMLAPSKIMQYLKGRSSKMLQDEFQDLIPISRAGGPGRYDTSYEMGGHDYRKVMCGGQKAVV